MDRTGGMENAHDTLAPECTGLKARFPHRLGRHRTPPIRSTGTLVCTLEHDVTGRISKHPLRNRWEETDRATSLRSDERSRSPESVFTFTGSGVHVHRNTHGSGRYPTPAVLRSPPTLARIGCDHRFVDPVPVSGSGGGAGGAGAGGLGVSGVYGHGVSARPSVWPGCGLGVEAGVGALRPLGVASRGVSAPGAISMGCRSGVARSAGGVEITKIWARIPP